MKNETLEGNKLLAEFMGMGFFNNERHFKKGTTKYHSDWSWLMPVFLKISQNEKVKTFSIHYSQVFINLHSDRGVYFKRLNNYEDLHGAVWAACVEFVKWYNQQKGATQ